MADGRADEYLTLDKKRLVVDHIARWRIVDPLTFYQTVRTEAGALARLDQIIGSRLREEIARHEFIQVIREQREQIMRAVTDETEVLARQFGIEVLDVRIKRLDLPAEVQESVFARMEAERHRIALRYRAEGEEAAGRSEPAPTRSGRSSWPPHTSRRSGSGAKATPAPPASTPKRTAGIPTSTPSCGAWRRTRTSSRPRPRWSWDPTPPSCATSSTRRAREPGGDESGLSPGERSRGLTGSPRARVQPRAGRLAPGARLFHFVSK